MACASLVAGLTVADVDLDAGTVRILGKGRKTRTVYLIESSAGALRAWLDFRGGVANPGELALFISLDRPHKGGGMSARAIRYMVDGYLADVVGLATILGHESLETLRIYTVPNSAKLANKVERLAMSDE